jgi:hypothetical protein
LKIIRPAELPRKALVLLGEKTKEFGELGSVTLFPAALVLTAMGNSNG